MNSCEFQARLYLTDTDGLIEYSIWCPEIEPMDEETYKRSCQDWIDESLTNYSPDDLREMLKLPVEGNFQVVCRGRLEGYWTQSCDGNEYDEDLELTVIEKAEIPVKWLEDYFKRSNERNDS